MKKMISVILSICLILAMSACKQEDSGLPNSNPSGNSTDVGNTSDSSGDDTVLVYPYPMTVASMPTVTQTSTAQDGCNLFTYTYQNLSLILEDTAVAEQIEVDFLNRIDFAATGANSIYQAAQADYTGQDDWIPYFYSIIYNTQRLDQRIFSLRGTAVSFDGSPRAATVSTSLTYDLHSGKALTLQEILVADYSADALVNAIITALQGDPQKDTFFFDYDAIISDMFSTNTPVESWYFSDAGLCFYFSPGEIAPGGSGIIISEIPYEALSGILADSYFPGERVEYVGNSRVIPFDDANQEAFSQFAEVIICQEDTPAMLLYTNGTICNVRLEIGSWTENGTEFFPEATVFAAEALSVGDGVLLYATQQQLAAMRLTYEASGQTVTQDTLLPANE